MILPENNNFRQKKERTFIMKNKIIAIFAISSLMASAYASIYNGSDEDNNFSLTHHRRSAANKPNTWRSRNYKNKYKKMRRSHEFKKKFRSSPKKFSYRSSKKTFKNYPVKSNSQDMRIINKIEGMLNSFHLTVRNTRQYLREENMSSEYIQKLLNAINRDQEAIQTERAKLNTISETFKRQADFLNKRITTFLKHSSKLEAKLNIKLNELKNSHFDKLEALKEMRKLNENIDRYER